MPRYPTSSERTRSVPPSPFAVMAPRMAELRADGRLFPFHLGDSYLLPAEPARRIDLDQEPIHRYCPVPGVPEYRRAVADWVGSQLGEPLRAENVFATTGCTGALSVIATSLFDPGDEVVVVTPSWPLIFGILSSQGVIPVEVPVGPDGWPEGDGAAFARALDEACSERTAGVYFCDPNNPAGFVVPQGHLSALRELVVRRGLWMVSDVVYKDLVLSQTPWQLPRLVQDSAVAERLVLAGSFSKSHLLAGHRAGFVIAPESLGDVITAAITHIPYSAGTSAQAMAVAALEAGPGEIERVRRSYAEGLCIARKRLRARFFCAEAGAFLFLDFRHLVGDAEQAMDLLLACLDAGVSLAPGAVFGRHFTRFARMCYTAAPVEVLAEGIQRLNAVLEGWRP